MQQANAIDPTQRQPMSRAEYERLVELGWFADERIELLRGFLVTMSPQGPMHAEVLRRLNKLLVPRLMDRAWVQLQSPLALGDDSEPEPDAAVVPLDDYSRAHPATAHLVIEIAKASQAKDRGIKLQLYAENRIPEYWIVDLIEGVIEVHTEPQGSAYRHVSLRRSGEHVSPLAFPDLSLAVDDIL